MVVWPGDGPNEFLVAPNTPDVLGWTTTHACEEARTLARWIRCLYVT